MRIRGVARSGIVDEYHAVVRDAHGAWHVQRSFARHTSRAQPKARARVWFERLWERFLRGRIVEVQVSDPLLRRGSFALSSFGSGSPATHIAPGHLFGA